MTYALKNLARLLGIILFATLIVLVWVSAAAAQLSFTENAFPIIELRSLECHKPAGDYHDASGIDMRAHERKNANGATAS